MKRIILFICLGLMVLIFVAVAFLPGRIVSDPRLRQAIEEKAAAFNLKELSLGQMEWVWLPYPRLLIGKSLAKTDDFTLESEQVEISVYLPGIFCLDPLPLRVDLVNVAFHLSRLPKPSKESTFSPPIRVLGIKNGRIDLSSGVSGGLFPMLRERLFLSHVNGAVNMSHEELECRLTMSSSLADRIETTGRFSIQGGRFDLKSRVDGLDFLAFKPADRKTPVGLIDAGKLNLSLIASGVLGGEINGHITAFSPCLTVKPKGSEVLLSCGSLKADFGVKEDLFALYLRELEFEAPKLALEGKVLVEFGHPDSDRAAATGPSSLEVDLAGRDIDLLALRRAVRTLLPWDDTAMHITDVVLGGRAERLSVGYKGKVSDMDDLDPWRIEAAVEDMPVYIPDADLRLDSVTGSLVIEKGVLRVDASRLLLRGTESRRAKAAIGLSHEDHRIDVEAELEAPFEDIYWSLGKFVDSKEFRTRLEDVEVLAGKASGTLWLTRPPEGGDIHVRVRAGSVEGELIYRPLDWPIKVSSGRVEYEGERVSWTGLSFRTKKSSITGCTGYLDFGKRGRLSIKEAKGTVQAEELDRLLSSAGVDLSRRPLRILHLEGRALVESFSMALSLKHGAEDSDRRFKWGARFSPRGLKLHLAKEVIPWPISANGGSIRLSDGLLTLNRVNIKAAGSAIKASGTVRADLADGMRANLDMSGLLEHRLSGFLVEKGLIPRRLAPKTPCTVRGLVIKYNERGRGDILVRGDLYWKRAEISAAFDFAAKGGHKDSGLSPMELKELVIRSGGREARASFLYLPSEPVWLRATFKGYLDSTHLDEILDDNWLLRGSFSGDLSLAVSSDEQGTRIDLDGELEAGRLFFPVTEDESLEFRHITLSARDSEGSVAFGASYMDDQFIFSSDFTIIPGLLRIYGDLSVPHLSNRTVEDFKALFLDSAALLPGPDKGQHGRAAKGVQGASFRMDLQGALAFAVDSLDIDLRSVIPSMPSHEMRIENILGSADFMSKDLWRVEVESDAMCGVILEVSLKKDEANRLLKHIHMKTADGKSVEFSRFFGCMGLPERRLAGPFTFDLLLDGVDQEWTDGYLKLEGRDGIIAKGGLLSRILGILNLTDLFSVSQSNVFGAPGFPYHKLELKAFISEPDKMEIEEAVVKGRGLNLYATGSMNLKDLTLDMMFFVSPLKSVDTIISHVPIIGAIIGGKHRTLFVIPVKVSGDVADPKIDVQQARAVTGIFEKLIVNVIKAPFSIFVPQDQGSKGEVERRIRQEEQKKDVE